MHPSYIFVNQFVFIHCVSWLRKLYICIFHLMHEFNNSKRYKHLNGSFFCLFYEAIHYMYILNVFFKYMKKSKGGIFYGNRRRQRRKKRCRKKYIKRRKKLLKNGWRLMRLSEQNIINYKQNNKIKLKVL